MVSFKSRHLIFRQRRQPSSDLVGGYIFDLAEHDGDDHLIHVLHIDNRSKDRFLDDTDQRPDDCDPACLSLHVYRFADRNTPGSRVESAVRYVIAACTDVDVDE